MDLLAKTDFIAKFNRIQKESTSAPLVGNWVNQLEIGAIEYMGKLFKTTNVEQGMEGEDDQVDVELNERFEELESKISRMMDICHGIAPEYVALIQPIVANMIFLKQIDFGVFNPALKKEAIKMTSKFREHVSLPEYGNVSVNVRLDKLAEFVDNHRKHSEFFMAEVGYSIPMSSRRNILNDLKKSFLSTRKVCYKCKH